ncbi:MAG: RNA methyltransferase, partial [Methanocellales archaeon]|nr:RNA methyltransferase [Methanocellales archaeon]
DDIERLYEHWRSVFEQINYPKHKRDKTLLMLRRILGRAMLTGREVQTLRGILRKTEWRIRK